jgi:hypothetical protein
MKKLLTFSITCISITTICYAQIPTDKELQIKMAVMAGPEELRADATVMGFNEKGELEIIREGSNELICRSDDPGSPNFETVCYHKDLEPFMARGRELRADGKGGQEIFDTREAEAKSGELKMPDKPATLHILYGGTDVTYDAAANTLNNVQYRYVIYIPYATEESTGLPLKPNGPGHPWLMHRGTHGAHIMITPPKN